MVQVYLIHNDKLMYDAVHDKSTECRALNIPEELSQVEFMFCDKTGTLTENKMVFISLKKLVVVVVKGRE